MRIDLWIECECPAHRGSDFELELPIGPDALIDCRICGGEHRAGDVGQLLRRSGHSLETLSEADWREIAAGRGP